MCDINTEEVHTRRRNMPLMKQRRWDLYRLQASDLAFQPNRRPALSISPEPRTSGDKSPAPGAEAGVDGRERKDAGGVDSVNSQG